MDMLRFQPMQMAIGDVLGFVGHGLRMRHSARTLPGLVGVAVLQREPRTGLRFIIAGDPKDWDGYKEKYNQAIPIKLIVDDLNAVLQPADKAVLFAVAANAVAAQ